MHAITSTELRQTLASVMDEVSQDRAPVLITRQTGENMVMIGAGEWEAIQETLHLFANPVNAAWLVESIAQAEAGKVHEFDLESGSFK